MLPFPAKELGNDYNPERIKHDSEKGIEITRKVYSTENSAYPLVNPTSPNLNFPPRNPDTDLNPTSRRLPPTSDH